MNLLCFSVLINGTTIWCRKTSSNKNIKDKIPDPKMLTKYFMDLI